MSTPSNVHISGVSGNAGNSPTTSKIVYTLVGLGVLNVAMVCGALGYVVTKVGKLEGMLDEGMGNLMNNGVGIVIGSIPKIFDGIAHDVMTYDYKKLAGAMDTFAQDINPGNCDVYCRDYDFDDDDHDDDDDDHDHHHNHTEHGRRLAEFEADMPISMSMDSGKFGCSACQMMVVGGPVLQLVGMRFKQMEQVSSSSKITNVPILDGLHEIMTTVDDTMELMPKCVEWAQKMKNVDWDLEGHVTVVSEDVWPGVEPTHIEMELDDSVTDAADVMIEFCTAVGKMTPAQRLLSAIDFARRP